MIPPAPARCAAAAHLLPARPPCPTQEGGQAAAEQAAKALKSIPRKLSGEGEPAGCADPPATASDATRARACEHADRAGGK